MSIDTQPCTGPADMLRVDPAAARILESLGVGLVVADPEGRIRHRNALATRWLGNGDDLESAFAGARFLGRFAGWEVELPRILAQDSTTRFDCALRGAGEKTPLFANLRCTPLRSDDPQRGKGVVILVTEKVEQAGVDERLEVSKRLASLGKLAARVAHELNNPLDGILRYINLAMRLVDEVPDPKLKDYLSESRTGLMRMVQIIGDLLEFSRSTEGEFEQATVNEIVEQAIRAHDSAANKSRVVIAGDFQNPNMPSVRGSRLYQVCCNLIRNAIEAMPNGGRLAVTTGILNDDVVIRVSDTGAGLPEPPEKVFEPFFTTKGPGKGTGIGLAICKDFIEDMRGTITASPGEESGAVFEVRIPVSACQSPAPFTGSRSNRGPQ